MQMHMHVHLCTPEYEGSMSAQRGRLGERGLLLAPWVTTNSRLLAAFVGQIPPRRITEALLRERGGACRLDKIR
jgi:hypothetical protein